MKLYQVTILLPMSFGLGWFLAPSTEVTIPPGGDIKSITDTIIVGGGCAGIEVLSFHPYAYDYGIAPRYSSEIKGVIENGHWRSLVGIYHGWQDEPCRIWKMKPYRIWKMLQAHK